MHTFPYVFLPLYFTRVMHLTTSSCSAGSTPDKSMFSFVKIDSSEFKKSLVKLWNLDLLRPSLLVLTPLSSSSSSWSSCASVLVMLLVLHVFILILLFCSFSYFFSMVSSESSVSKLIDIFFGNSILTFFFNSISLPLAFFRFVQSFEVFDWTTGNPFPFSNFKLSPASS